ncbi:MobA/MobL family protein [Devosia marina]|uniref:MobA/MobL family protein n=1 Tax=Devosia marina TaxID=2683198 RepID=UPI0012F8A0F3|nr:MobA/MobL family protein [Devosia marina]
MLAAAYIGRARLAAPYPTTDYSDREDLLIPMRTLLPQDAPTEFEDPWFLWSEMERAALRKDASLGLHLILALPAPNEFPAPLYEGLVESFITDLIAPHSLAVSYAVHRPHLGGRGKYMDWLENGASPQAYAAALSSRNQHAHVLISGRRLTAAGIDPRRYTALDPTHGGKGGARGGVDWPRLWHHHQNAFFARHGLGLRVRPWAKYADTHLGPDRARAARHTDAAIIERANRSAVSDPVQLLKLVATRPFNERDLREIVDRYAPRAHPYDRDSVDATLELPNVARLAYPNSEIRSPWYATAELQRAEQSCKALAEKLANKPFTPQSSYSSASASSTGSLTIVEGLEASGWVDAPDDNSADTIAEAIHGWPSLLGLGHKIDIRRQTYSLPKDGIVVLDHADAVTPFDLERLLDATKASENSKLVLVRRPSVLSHQRSSLLDALFRAVSPGAMPSSYSPKEYLLVRGMLDAMAREERIVFSTHTDLLTTARELFKKNKAAGKSPVFICPDHEFAAMLRLERLPVRAVAPSTDTIVVHCEPSFGNLSLLGLLASANDLTLLVDRRYCPHFSALCEQAETFVSWPSSIAVPRSGGSSDRSPIDALFAQRDAKPSPTESRAEATDELHSAAAQDVDFKRSANVHQNHTTIGEESDYLSDAPDDLPEDLLDEAEPDPGFETEDDVDEDFEDWEGQEMDLDDIEDTHRDGGG